MTASSHSYPAAGIVAGIPAAGIVAGINDTRAALEKLRAALISPVPEASPDSILACLPALAEAAGKLSVVERELLSRVTTPKAVGGAAMARGGSSAMKQTRVSARRAGALPDSAEIARAVESLKSDLRGIVRLIEHGATFYSGWARLLGAAAGYTPTGEAAPLDAPSSVALDG